MKTTPLKKHNCYFIFLFVVTHFLILSCENKPKATEKTHKYTNALINETSPYLLQHAHNPVDWRAWSQEALDEAKEKNKLVLVSIGYSSCHWCHVMEEETFENDSIATLMNENFINIKVDREERPDVDQIYMTAVQLMKGNGGWPLNVITLPNGKPLYGGTYHTKNQWQKVISEISRLYKEDPIKAAEYSDMVAEGIAEVNLIAPSTDFESLNKDVLANSLKKWKSSWDSIWGGDKSNEKFMLPSNLDFLLDYALLTDDKETLKHVELTLDKMAMGGIYDHVGGGFFRYSTDTQWKVPHFEKMLYDNAQALSLYSKAYKVFKKERYKQVILGTIEFLEREMKNPEGGYYAALDADSEGEEGKFYIWTEKELELALGSDFKLFAAYYNIRKETLWEHDKYILHTSADDSDFATVNSISIAELSTFKKKWQQKLLEERKKRVMPRTDDKIITSWNALLINGYVDAYTAIGNKVFLDNALSILNFIKSYSYKEGKLGHSYKENSKHIDAFLEDYSFLANGVLQLYSTTMNVKQLEFAQELTQTAKENFKDDASGMFTYSEGNELISKLIKTDDGVIPSPNTIMAHNLFQLGHIFYKVDETKKSKTMASSIVPLLKENPYAYSKWAALITKTVYPYYEVAVVGENADKLLLDLNKKYIPNILLIGNQEKSDIALFQNRYIEGDTFIYVCIDNSCKLPVNNVSEAIDLLKSNHTKTYGQ